MTDAIHKFEAAGLGKAPFKCVGFFVQHGSSCDYCSTAIMNVFIVKSSDGKESKIGSECVLRTGDGGLKTEMKIHRKAAKVATIKVAKAAMVAKTKADLLAKHHGLEMALETDHPIVIDIAARFNQYGSLSDKQIALVMKLQAQVSAPPEEKEKTVAAPIGPRQTFTGTVVSAKLMEGQFGTTYKMTVKVTTSEGVWLAWGTIPSSLLAELSANGRLVPGELVEAEVEITATLKSGKDVHFAIMNRPAGKILQMKKSE